MSKIIKQDQGTYRFEEKDKSYLGDMRTIVSLMIFEGYELEEIESGFVSLEVHNKTVAHYGIAGRFMF